MSVGWWLVNFTKKEQIAYLHIPAETARELAGNPVSAAITTWYLLHNSGDTIAFVSDCYDDWPFPRGSKKDLSRYRDVTDQVVTQLLREGILADEGRETFFPDEPEVYIRKLRNVWMD